MAIKYSVDELIINEFAGRSRIMMNGWCAGTDGSIPVLTLYVNGKETEYTLFSINRYDAVKVMHLPDQARRCGFMISVKNIPEKIQTLEVKAETDAENRKIVDLNGSMIDTLKEKHSILCRIDGVSYDSENKMFHISGWAFSELKEPITFSIRKEDGTVSHCDARRLSRDDLVRLGYVERDEKYCGFMISYPCAKHEKLNLVLSADDETREVPVVLKHKYTALLTLKSLVTNISPVTLAKTAKYLRRHGVIQTLRRLRLGYAPSDAYDEWFRGHRVTEEQLNSERAEKFAYRPKISLLVPTFNTPLDLLKEMIETVRNQSYDNWELCIADGSKPTGKTREAIRQYAQKDSRIRVTYLDQNYGISGNTNKALELATGDYTAMYDHDDFLELNALYEVVKVLNNHRYDIIYTDEDKFSMETGHFEDPNLKPDFSIDLLRSHNYITHLFVVKTDILKGIGGFHKEYDGSQDYDVILRCIEKTDQIYHLPKILYHWRMHSGSTAADPESKMYCYEAGQKAIEDHLKRCGLKGTVSMLGKPYYGLYHTQYATPGDPLVSIIIPNYENCDVLKRCVDSLYAKNNYQNFELIIVENNSRSEEIFSYYEQLKKAHSNVKVVTWKGGEFNYSAINNYGVKYAEGKYLLFLNNDTEVIAPDAIREMLGCCMREEVGIVGAKLLYEDDTVQHAGVIIGFGGSAGHVFSRIEADEPGFMMRAVINCNYSAVTAACMMTKRDVFDSVEGFDETLKVAFNDIDFCLKVRATGKLVVYNAFALWYHYESISRGYETSPEKAERFEREIRHFQEKWKQFMIDGDPYYNANFDVSYTPFELH